MVNNENCPVGVKHEAEISELKLGLGEVRKDVKEIKEKLLNRPSWTVSIIITFLSTLAFSSLTFAFTIVHELANKTIP